MILLIKKKGATIRFDNDKLTGRFSVRGRKRERKKEKERERKRNRERKNEKERQKFIKRQLFYWVKNKC